MQYLKLHALLHSRDGNIFFTIYLLLSSSTATELCALHKQLYSFEINYVHLHGRLFCVRFFDKNESGKVTFTQRRL